MMLKHPKNMSIGAVAFTALIACTPATPPFETAAARAPAAPAPAASASAPIGPPPANIDPGYIGAWAAAETDCGDPAKVIKMTGQTIELMRGEGECTIGGIDEQHPSGRSMIYTIKANCVSPGRTGEDTFRINFGASDTAVQFQQNAREPVRLVRCPPGVTP